MPWTTAGGSQFNYPFDLYAKIARSTKLDRNDVLDMLAMTYNLHTKATRMEATLNELMAENTRLLNENKFMLRLINARDNHDEKE